MSIKFINQIDNLRSKPDAVIFDTDNTIYEYDPAHLAAMNAVAIKIKKLLGVNNVEFHTSFLNARNQIKTQLSSTASSHSRLLYFQRTLEILGLKTQLLLTLDLEQTYWRTFLATSKLFPFVKEFILDLRSAGIKTAIITDLTAQIQFRKIIYFGLDKYFDYVVTSEESGFDKPNHASFLLAIKKLAVDPNKCWMIGDSAKADIMGAKKLNMITLQKLHLGVEEATNDNLPDCFFNSFKDLQNFIHKSGWIQDNFEEEYA